MDHPGRSQDEIGREALRWALGHVEREVGPVVAADEIGGTAPGWRLRAEIAGVGRVFLKVADGSGWSAEAVGGEAALLTTVRHRHMPHVVAADPLGDVPWMVQRDLGDGWPPPWPEDLRPLWRALRRLARASPPPWLARPDDVDPWAPLHGQDRGEWWRPHAADLAVAARRVRLDGDALVHGDLGAGNVCWSGGQPIVVDWSDAYVGNPAIDLVTVAVDVAHAEDRRVPPPVEDLGAWMAKVAGLLLGASRRPAWPGPGGAQVRAEQDALARTAVSWALALLDG